MKRLRLVVVAVAQLATAVAAGQSLASGTLTVKGSTTSFAYAYVFWKALPADPSRSHLHVLLTDVPVPEASLPQDDKGLSAMAQLTRENGIHAIELRFVSVTQPTLFDAEQGAVYHAGIAPARHGFAGFLKFEGGGSRDGRSMKGKVTVLDPALTSLLGMSVTATFAVTVPPKP